jgi:hypothetical protein
MKSSHAVVETRLGAVVGIADLPPLPETCTDDCDVDNVHDNLLDLGGGKDQPSIRMKQNEFSWKQFAKRIGYANYSLFNKLKIVRVAETLENMDQSIIWRQTHSNNLRDFPLLCEQDNDNLFGDI